jgi:uncharacterized protein
MEDVTLAALVLGLAALLQAVSGFGFALLSVPLLSLFITPKVIFPIMLIQGSLVNLVVLGTARKGIQLKSHWIMIVTGLIGIPFGAWLLYFMSPEALKLFIGVVTVVVTLLIWFDVRLLLKDDRVSQGIVGFSSGLLNGSITLSGPPVILYFAGKKVQKTEFRATLCAYFLILNLATAPFYFAAQLFTERALTLSLISAPVVILGAVLGVMLANRLSQELFRKISLVLVFVIGLLSMFSGLRSTE